VIHAVAVRRLAGRAKLHEEAPVTREFEDMRIAGTITSNPDIVAIVNCYAVV
jgi:hypothetical protein